MNIFAYILILISLILKEIDLYAKKFHLRVWIAKVIEEKKVDMEYTITPRVSSSVKDAQCVFSFKTGLYVIQTFLAQICAASNNPKFEKQVIPISLYASNTLS